jgi:hypothetical protein
VFLVEDHQAQVLEFDVLLDQAMGADDDVDVAFLQTFDGLGLFLGGAEARDLGDLDRPFGETIGEIVVMLFGEQGVGTSTAT